MSNDARFEDYADLPLRLEAQDPDDLTVLSSLVQDAVTQADAISWRPRNRGVSLLLNRFRWEDSKHAQSEHRPYERVRSVLHFDSVMAVKTSGIDPNAKDTILSLLALRFEPGEDGGGRILLTFAGDGEIRLEVECIDIRLADVTRPYEARAKNQPDHKLE